MPGNYGSALQGGVAGAGAGASFGPWGAAAMGAAGLLGGFLGGPQLPPELRRLYRLQYSMADQLRRFAQSVPLSDPGEQAALASARAQLGEQQRNQQGQLYAALNRNQGVGNLGDFLTNLNQQQVGGQMALNNSALQSAMQQRRAALGGASQIGQAAAATYQPFQGPDFGAIGGNIARLIAMNQGQHPNTPPPVQGPQLQMPNMGGFQGGMGSFQNSFQGGGMSNEIHNFVQPSPINAIEPANNPTNLTLKWDWKQKSGRT